MCCSGVNDGASLLACLSSRVLERIALIVDARMSSPVIAPVALWTLSTQSIAGGILFIATDLIGSLSDIIRWFIVLMLVLLLALLSLIRDARRIRSTWPDL